MTELQGMEGTTRDHWVQPPSLQVPYNGLQRWVGVQMGTEYLHTRGLHHLSEQPVPVFHHPDHKVSHPYCKEYLPLVKEKKTKTEKMLHHQENVNRFVIPDGSSSVSPHAEIGFCSPLCGSVPALSICIHATFLSCMSAIVFIILGRSRTYFDYDFSPPRGEWRCTFCFTTQAMNSSSVGKCSFPEGTEEFCAPRTSVLSPTAALAAGSRTWAPAVPAGPSAAAAQPGGSKCGGRAQVHPLPTWKILIL